jgi:DNA-binding NarL/FixJ family response regulator
MPIRIVLADDHVLVREGLKSLLEREGFQVVAEASNGQEAFSHVELLPPDIVVMDISMPTLNGLNAAQKMTRSSPKTKTILLTQHDEGQYIREALEAGVKGYVLKSQVASDLLLAIRQVSRSSPLVVPVLSRPVPLAAPSISTKRTAYSVTQIPVLRRQSLSRIRGIERASYNGSIEASQASDVGSIPIARSILKTNCRRP